MTLIRKVGLVKETISTDSIGQPVKTSETREVIAELRSVTGTEFSQGRQNGLSPQYCFVISIFDYHGEETVVYDGKNYSVYRTYIADDNTIEIYTEAETGVTYG